MVSCSRHVRISAGPASAGAGFNYDHCQSPPPAPARVSFSEKPWLSFSHNTPPSHYSGPHQSHCSALLAMMRRFCWPLKCYVSSLPDCTCAVPVSRLRMSQSSVTLVTWLSSPEPAFTWSTAQSLSRLRPETQAHIWISYTPNVK